MIAIADLKRELGYPDEEGVTTLLTDLEARAVDFVENETERFFGASEARTEIIVGSGSGTLFLRENPSAITSIEERAQVGDSWTPITESDDDGFELRRPLKATSSQVARVLRKAGWTWVDGYEYRAIYNFGYTAGSEPGEIRRAVIDVTAFTYRQRGTEGFASYRSGDVSWAVLQSSGARSLYAAIPGLDRTLSRWRGRTFG